MKWLPYDLEEEVLKLDSTAEEAVDLAINVLCNNEEKFNLTLSNAEDEETLLARGEEYIPIYSPLTTFENIKIAKNLFHKSKVKVITQALQNLLKQVKNTKGTK